jgi:TrmH family RNA methyltransferase
MAEAYAPGAYTTRELILSRPETVRAVYIHPQCDAPGETEMLCRMRGIPVHTGERYFSLINQKENTYVLAAFSKYQARLSGDGPHVVLVCVNDEGNLGAMLRTALACGIRDVALVGPSADAFHPRAVRASRGAVFWLNVQSFGAFEAYRDAHPGHALYPFMLGAGCAPDAAACAARRFSLIFGNESTGLPPSFADIGEVITIPQTAHVDSLNVAVAMGIGTFLFARKNGLV